MEQDPSPVGRRNGNPGSIPVKKKAAHEELFKGLKVEKVVVPLPEEDQICPVCGTQMVLIGEEYVRRELEFIPATCKVIEYYSQSYGCPSCKEGPGDTEKPVIAMSMGNLGSMSRIAGENFGSSVTFATVGKASAPGQFRWKSFG